MSKQVDCNNCKGFIMKRNIFMTRDIHVGIFEAYWDHLCLNSSKSFWALEIEFSSVVNISASGRLVQNVV